MTRPAVFAALSMFLAGSAYPEQVAVCRDVWGIPHIAADTEAGAAYGLGWAQAEDRLEQLLRNYRLATGTMAEAFGPDHVEDDYQRRLVGQQEVCRRRYPELPAKLRAMIEAFQAGVKAYMAAHPEQVPDWAPPIEPWMALALGREIILNWPLDTARDELGRRDQADPGFGSNQWAVQPHRTAEGCAMLCIDPHIPWDGVFRFYEFRAHGGRWNVRGFGPLGAPLVGLGHNQYLGWACTTGGPDTADVYAEEINPGNPRQYRYDGAWRDMAARPVTINVAGAAPVEREIEYTHHGPIMLREGNTAYALACPYIAEVDLVTQLYRMNTARNLRQFQRAVGMNQLMEQNVMYADVEGNTFYVRTGRVPVRPDGFDFSRPVPGNTSGSEWRGLHPMADLVQMLNPTSGWMQNCNIGPDTMTVDCPLKAEDYPPYIFGTGPGRSNSRGRRASELLAAADHLTLEQAIEIVLDTHAEGAEQWQAAVAGAAAAAGDQLSRTLRSAVGILAAWNCRMDVNQPGATLYRTMRELAPDTEPRVDVDPLSHGEELSGEQQQALLHLVAAAADELKGRHGRIEVPYGDVHRIRRGSQSWPAAGGDTGGGSTLRAVGATRDPDGIYYGHSGQSWTQLVLLRPGAVESYSATPYGQSDHPDSPHYADQAAKLYSKTRLKPTWFMPDELEEHIESTTHLEYESSP